MEQQAMGAEPLGPRSRSVFGNRLPPSVLKKALRARERFAARFGADQADRLCARIGATPALGALGSIKTITVCQAPDGQGARLAFPAGEKPLVIGTIRMGYGHFRISLAMASAARALGFTPYWFDLHSFADTAAGKIIRHQNELYSLGSRLSQKYGLFNKLYWEPLNSQGFRQLAYNAVDQAVSELMAPVCRVLPADVPFVATHVWPAQAAIHAGMSRVVNAIPDNWAMALHLAEGAVHAVQTPFAWYGYHTLRGMDASGAVRAETRRRSGEAGPAERERAGLLSLPGLLPMPEGSLVCAGHYLDHEFVSRQEADCRARLERRQARAPLRLLISIGGAGAQKDFILRMLGALRPQLDAGRLVLWINVGDHQGVRDGMLAGLAALGQAVALHQDWQESQGLDPAAPGHRLFCHLGIFEAVYQTNQLLAHCDLLVTKPSELAFYAVPKLLIKRIGGHEAWGAIRAADLGDGTPELDDPLEAAACLARMLADPQILGSMNHAILNAAQSGTYRGAYRVVELAGS